MSKGGHGPLGDGRRAWEQLSRWLRRAGEPGDGDAGVAALDALTDVGIVRRSLDQAELLAVQSARRHGRSWSEIAARVGMSRQSAWERWRDVDEAGPGAEPGEAGGILEAVAEDVVATAVPSISTSARGWRRRSTVSVPRVIGMTVEAAQLALSRARLSATNAEIGADPLALVGWPHGVVTGQAPEQGARVPRGTAVKLWVGNEGGGNAGVREPRRPKPPSGLAREEWPLPSDEAVG